jgi:hypothetical protein
VVEAELPWVEGRRYELIPRDPPPDPAECISEDRTLRVQLPMSRRGAWGDLISRAFGEKMKIIEAIDNNAVRVAVVIPPLVPVVFQEFSLWTPTQFTKRPKVDEGSAVLQTQFPRLDERKHYQMFIGKEEMTWIRLPTERVYILPKRISLPADRGSRADTTNMYTGKLTRERR